jgi:hypothetical protein
LPRQACSTAGTIALARAASAAATYNHRRQHDPAWEVVAERHAASAVPMPPQHRLALPPMLNRPA